MIQLMDILDTVLLTLAATALFGIFAGELAQSADNGNEPE